MRQVTVISLIICLSSIAIAEKPSEILQRARREHPGLFAAPELPPWPKGLPPPKRLQGGGIELDALRADATHSRLVACRVLPSRCQARIDAIVKDVGAELDGVAEVAINGAVDAAATKTEADRVAEDQKNHGYSLSTLAIVGAVAVVVGVLIGGATVVYLDRD